MSEWISVDDRLPEMEVDVLVYAENGYMTVCSLVYTGVANARAWEDTNSFYIVNVTHWMPLPSTEGLHDENT